MSICVPDINLMANPVVSVIIINFNTKDLTLKCLRSLSSCFDSIPIEVFVVDNASTDGSLGAIREECPWVKLIANSRNIGFGAANNQAMKMAKGEYFLLLNSDAFPKSGALSHLLNYLTDHQEVAVVGPQLLNQDGSHQMSWHCFPSPSREWANRLWLAAIISRLRTFLCSHGTSIPSQEWSRTHNTDYVNGACMLVSRKAYEEVGGFDERFFMYYEEADWHQRFTSSGWKLAYEPSAKVEHLHGASSHSNKAWIYRHFYDALDYYIWKHYHLPGLISVRIAVITGALLNLFRCILLKICLRNSAAVNQNMQLYSWLLIRQATKWNISPEKRPS